MKIEVDIEIISHYISIEELKELIRMKLSSSLLSLEEFTTTLLQEKEDERVKRIIDSSSFFNFLIEYYSPSLTMVETSPKDTVKFSDLLVTIFGVNQKIDLIVGDIVKANKTQRGYKSSEIKKDIYKHYKRL